MRYTGISGRLYGLVVIGTLGLIAITFASGLSLKHSLLDDRIGLTRQVDEVALSGIKGFYERAQKGEMTEAAAMEAAKQYIRTLRYGNNEYFFVYDTEGMNVAHGRDQSREGKSFADFADDRGKKYIREFIEKAKGAGGGDVDYWSPKIGAEGSYRKISYVLPFAPWKWVVGTGLYVDDVDAEFRGLILRLGWAVAVIFLTTGGIAFLVSRSVAQGVESLRGNMDSMSHDSLDIHIGAMERKDEIGDMARALEGFRGNLLRIKQIEEERRQFEERTREDQAKAAIETASRYEVIAGAMAENVRGAATDLLKTANAMGNLVGDSVARTRAVDESSKEAAATVGTVAAATEQLTASIDEINTLVGRSSAGAHDVAEKAERSNALIKSLADAALQISDVVQLITDIASQTNLLALNATIEAARAGEAGKGFAVVANEVKNLATATARATGDITERIRAVQEESRSAAQAIAEIVASISTISQVSEDVSAAVGRQDAATRDIVRNIQIAAASTRQVSGNVVSMLDIADHTGQSTKELVVSAHIMAGLANELEEKVREFGQFVRKG